MKKITLVIIFALMATQLAFAETSSFRVGATVPRIIGVNYFPEVADIASDEPSEVIQQLVMRDGQKLMMKTTIAR